MLPYRAIPALYLIRYFTLFMPCILINE